MFISHQFYPGSPEDDSVSLGIAGSEDEIFDRSGMGGPVEGD